MSRYRRHKDTAHPAVVQALLAAGCLVVVLEQARWAGGGRKQQTAGAPDLFVTLSGRTVALEVKTPGAAKSRREDPDQLAFGACASLASLNCYLVSSPLEALAAVGCTTVEARRGLAAAERAERNGGMGSEMPTRASGLHLDEVANLLAEARQRLGVSRPQVTE